MPKTKRKAIYDPAEERRKWVDHFRDRYMNMFLSKWKIEGATEEEDRYIKRTLYLGKGFRLESDRRPRRLLGLRAKRVQHLRDPIVGLAHKDHGRDVLPGQGPIDVRGPQQRGARSGRTGNRAQVCSPEQEKRLLPDRGPR